MTHSPFTVSRCIVEQFPAKSEFCTVAGRIYRFLCNVTDSMSLPREPYTTFFYSDPEFFSVEPKIWRAASANPSIVVEIEEHSDIGSRTMKEEAQNAWASFTNMLEQKARWFAILGVHPDLRNRICEPGITRFVEVHTLQDDYLAKMFAHGNPEIAKLSSVLHQIEVQQRDYGNLVRMSFEEFLWPEYDVLEDWKLRRYEAALQGQYHFIQSSFAPQS